MRVSAEIDVWDAWPLAARDGRPLPWRGGELWFALAAPVDADPERRHGVASIHHFHRIDGRFAHIGPTFPVGFSPGSREWSGCAVACGKDVTLYFTAAGVRGETAISSHQRIFSAATQLVEGPGVFAEWSDPVEIVRPDGHLYMHEHEGSGRPGQIKAFRDPAFYCLSDGTEYLVFTASSARKPEEYNGVIGCAVGEGQGSFRVVAPLIDACGTNNELERPHIVEHAGRLYLFWSTQAAAFSPGIDAPTGLYGAVSESMAGPWRLLNRHGLVFANAASEPFQSYSWWVLPDLSVAAFVDYWGVGNVSARSKPQGRRHFGGTFAPFLKVRLDGDTAALAEIGA
ncbi:glycoside hydrolase family 68 protein [Novosphingobium malaysiense]|uniref:glycoside hydrolase family 68 protein n=1 Tax=Novosphingobium malaysiense TaxID=1348853 RepID=UPI000AEBAAF4|nr:glycoside hydrolase family 68 protein [Novosphingobium malaysiense]